MAKGAREKSSSNQPELALLPTSKNKRTTPGTEFAKYDPVVRKHVAYKEVKLIPAVPSGSRKPAPARSGLLFMSLQ